MRSSCSLKTVQLSPRGFRPGIRNADAGRQEHLASTRSRSRHWFFDEATSLINADAASLPTQLAVIQATASEPGVIGDGHLANGRRHGHRTTVYTAAYPQLDGARPCAIS